MLLNPPWLFDMLLAVMRPFIDAKTMAKVKIVRPSKEPGALAAELAALGVTDAAQVAWLEAVTGMEAVPGSLPPFAGLRGAVPKEMRLPHAELLLEAAS